MKRLNGVTRMSRKQLQSQQTVVVVVFVFVNQKRETFFFVFVFEKTNEGRSKIREDLNDLVDGGDRAGDKILVIRRRLERVIVSRFHRF